MDQNKMNLTIGEFAKLCHTTKHTLFHYCDIGLFMPAFTDDNGYRFYHALQYDTFMTIAQLREIGMPLSEIKQYLEQRSPERMVELYQQQEQQIGEQIAQLQRIKARMSSQRVNIQQVLSCSEEFFMEQRKKTILLCSDMVSQHEDNIMASVIGDLIHSAQGKFASNTLGMLCPKGAVGQTAEYPFCFYIETTSTKEKNSHIKPEGTYFATYHRGGYETLGDSYQRLLSYGYEHQIRLDDWLYVETILGDWAVSSQEDYVLKVSAKVKGSEELNRTSIK